MDPAEKKKYNHMENVLNKINQKYISLPEDEKRRNTKILEQITDTIICKMKEKDVLFRNMFERKFYGGSYYDGIKVGKPEEYDLDFVLNLPLIVEPKLENSSKEGFVRLSITEYVKLLKREEAPKYSKLDGLMDGQNYLCTDKVLQWMESTINLALKDFAKDTDGHIFNVDLGDVEPIKMYATVTKAYPAFTLKLKNKDGSVNLDIDLVPCFQFTNELWPGGKYRKNPVPSKNKFLIVPKKPHEDVDCPSQNIERFWRLSFQEQERELIKGHDFKSMKPTIKLLKKLRDKQNHQKIASYYIKTIFLWEVEAQTNEFWKMPLSFVFMAMLNKFADMVKSKSIPYYWNKNYNLIGHLQDVTITDIGNTLKNIIKDVDRHLADPFTIVKYLITPPECEILRTEVELGKKHVKNMKITQCLNSSLSSPPPLNSSLSSPPPLNSSLSSTPPLNSSDCVDGVGQTEDDKVKKLVLDEEFLREVSRQIATYLEPHLQPPVSSGREESANNEILSSLRIVESNTSKMTDAISSLQQNNIRMEKKLNDLETNVADLTRENTMLRSKLHNANDIVNPLDFKIDPLDFKMVTLPADALPTDSCLH